VKNKYVLITPVHNEANRVANMIRSIVSQTVRPKKWVIVNDASTDNTAESIGRYEAEYDFITQLKLVRDGMNSYYAHRTRAILAGYEQIKHLEFDFVACLDSDISIQPTYYESILEEFNRNPMLGIATGIYINKVNGRLERVIRDNTSTPGGLQMFRRECYETIGGYRLMRYGGDDSLAGIMAQMHGWETRAFPQCETIHDRPTGTACGKGILVARFYQGFAEYNLATHPVFMLAKSLRRALIEKPYIVGSFTRFVGYIVCSLKKGKRDIPDDAATFVRKEQISRLFSIRRSLK
jgi:biofilm PGA synthesis N-glycosyltransferase PgaC